MAIKKRKKKDFEIRFYEAILKEKPRFRQVLISLGDAYTRKGFYEEGLVVDKRLSSLMPDDPLVYYNLACSHSLVGELDLALSAIKRAVVLGYDDLPYLLKDKDLQKVRETPKFKDFLAKIKKT